MYVEDLEVKYSKSNKDKCRECKQIIEIGYPRIGFSSNKDFHQDGNSLKIYWSHLTCFKIVSRFKVVNPCLIKGYESMKGDDQKQILVQFQSGGNKNSGINQLAQKWRERKKKQKRMNLFESLIINNAINNSNERIQRIYTTDNLLLQLEGQGIKQKYQNDFESDQLDTQFNDIELDENEIFKINVSRRSKNSTNSKTRSRQANKKILSDIDEVENEENSSQSFDGKLIESQQKIKSRQKQIRNVNFKLGYTLDQQKQYSQIYETLKQKNNYQLKSILQINNQEEIGSRGYLLKKCADGQLLGAIPKCIRCKTGQLNFNENDGYYKCQGIIHIDGRLILCSQKYESSEVKRLQWKSNYSDSALD